MFTSRSVELVMKIGGDKGVTPANDLTLADIDVERSRVALRQKIKNA